MCSLRRQCNNRCIPARNYHVQVPGMIIARLTVRQKLPTHGYFLEVFCMSA